MNINVLQNELSCSGRGKIGHENRRVTKKERAIKCHKDMLEKLKNKGKMELKMRKCNEFLPIIIGVF